MSTNPFDWLNSINDTKINLMKNNPEAEKGYNAFMVNRGLSYYPDTIAHANEMNRNHLLGKRLQYEFYLSSVSKRKRFSKWAKKEDSADLTLIKKQYNVSEPKALEILKLLSPAQLQRIKEMQFKGGR